MAFFRHLLKYPLANRPGQYLLRKQVKVCNWLMGIGAGADVDDSGETALMKRFAAKANATSSCSMSARTAGNS
jgi:hypothetical protein